MANFAIGYVNSTRMTLVPHIRYEGNYQSAVNMYKNFHPPMNEDDLYISPAISAVETAFTDKAGRLVIVGGKYNDATKVFVADFVKEIRE